MLSLHWCRTARIAHWPKEESEASKRRNVERTSARDQGTSRRRIEGMNRHRGAVARLPLPPYMRVRIRRFSELGPCGPEVRVIVRHKGFARFAGFRFGFTVF